MSHAETTPPPPPSLRAILADEPPHRRVWIVARRVFRGLFVHHAFDHAATMAFYFFLGTIPLMVMASLLLGHVVEREGAESIAQPIYRLMPGVTAQLVKSELADIAAAPAGSVAPISVGGFLWLTSNGFHNLMDVFELLIGAKPRPWWKQRVIAVGWVVATLLAAFLSVSFLLVTLGWSRGVDDASQMPALLRRLRDELAEGWTRLGVLIVFVVVMTIGAAAFYRLAVDHPRAVRRRVWPGTAVAILLWALVTWAFGEYVATIGHYAVFYGSLATVAVTLLWLYLSSLAFLVGAEVNAQLEGVRDPRPSPAL